MDKMIIEFFGFSTAKKQKKSSPLDKICDTWKLPFVRRENEKWKEVWIVDDNDICCFSLSALVSTRCRHKFNTNKRKWNFFSASLAQSIRHKRIKRKRNRLLSRIRFCARWMWIKRIFISDSKRYTKDSSKSFWQWDENLFNFTQLKMIYWLKMGD